MKGDLCAVVLGHLSHPDRRRVVAALLLGATTLTDVEQATGLGTRTVVSALGRLGDAGLVLGDQEGRFWLVEQAFRQAATEARRAGAAEEGGDEPPAGDRVLRSFVRGRRLLSVPVQRSKRLVVLDLLAQEFEPGRRYPERRVNAILGGWHEDTASLRRYLVDEGFLDRDGGQYWRAGGTFVS